MQQISGTVLAGFWLSVILQILLSSMHWLRPQTSSLHSNENSAAASGLCNVPIRARKVPFFSSVNEVLSLTWIGLTSYFGQRGRVISVSGPSLKYDLMDEILLRGFAN